MSSELERAKSRLFAALRSRVPSGRIVDAMERVPRELFVPESIRHQSYEDFPLPIGDGQTVSQPHIVAVMTHALELKEGDSVLELGTGSGYQAAILSLLTRQVLSVERIPSLAGAGHSLAVVSGVCQRGGAPGGQCARVPGGSAVRRHYRYGRGRPRCRGRSWSRWRTGAGW